MQILFQLNPFTNLIMKEYEEISHFQNSVNSNAGVIILIGGCNESNSFICYLFNRN